MARQMCLGLRERVGPWDGVTKRLWVEVEPEEDADREDDLDTK